MKRPENDNWLDEALTKAIGSEKSKTNFEEWKEDHPEAIEMLTSRADRQASVTVRPLSIRRQIMKSPITKLAAAAVIIVGVMIGISQRGGSNVAWAQVSQKIDQALTYICSVHLRDHTREEKPLEIEAVVYGSSEHGQKQDVRINGKLFKHTYFLPAEKVEIDVMPAEKQYRRKSLTDEDIEKRGGDMREMLKKCMAYKHKNLGRDTIKGKNVEGIEVYDPNLCTASFTVDSLTAQLWVDVETNLPVLLRAEITGTKGEKAILKAENFQWNVELDPSIFEPKIPDDYTAVE